MQLAPRYDGPAVLRIDGSPGDPSIPLVRQRRRLAALLAQLDDAQWATPSRCAGWSVRDVVVHLIGVDGFWVHAITSALAGEPTRHLTAFDPVATPAAMVAAAPVEPPAVLAERLADGVEALAATVAGLDAEQWALPSEAPPGHLALAATARHALWDAWIHERDIVLPLGLTPVHEPDEVRASLEYAVGLGPAFLATSGRAERTGALAVVATDPEVRLAVEVGDVVVVRPGDAPAGTPCLEGPAVDLVEALSFRGPFPRELAAEDRWLLGGLGEVFDQVS